MSPLDWFHTIGALIAIGTGAYTLYDRTLRHRPILSLATHLDGVNPQTTLRITNVAPYDIYVDRITVEPPGFGVSNGTTTRAIIPVMLGEPATAVLGPEENIRLVVVKLDLETRNLSEDTPIVVTAYWQRSEGRWLRPMPSTLRTSRQDIENRERTVILTGQRV